MLIGTRRSLLGVGGRYIDKVLSVEPGNLIGLWLQNEGSGSVSYDLSGNAHNGAYTGVTLGQTGVPGMGYTCPFYDGANDYNTILSPELAAAFNAVAGTLLGFCKLNDVNVWTDGTNRTLARIYVNQQNRIYINRNDTNNNIGWSYEANDVNSFFKTAGHSDVDWMSWALTWDKNAGATGEVKGYKNGLQESTTKTSLGTWAGTPSVIIIGADHTAPAAVFHGWLGPVLLYTKALTDAQILYLSTV